MSRQRRRRLPTWALALLVIICFSGAAWLFVAGDGSDDASTNDDDRAAVQDDGKDRVEGVLSLPDEDDLEKGAGGRRDERGRNRIDPDAAIKGSNGTKGTSTAPLPGDLPSVLAAVRDRPIALVGASTAGPAASSDSSCASFAAPNRSKAEQQLLDGIAAVLERAAAKVNRPDAPSACVKERTTRAASSDVQLVVRAGTSKDPVVHAGLPVRGAAAPTRSSTALAAELAAALGLKSVAPIEDDERRQLARSTGATEQKGGPAVALLEIDLRNVKGTALDDLALDIATAIGVAVSRADVRSDS